VLVTGGAGYIGSTLVPLLLGEGYRVRVLDIDAAQPRLPQSSRLIVMGGDVRDRAALREAARGCAAVVHLAALSGAPACARDPGLAEEVNVGGCEALAEAAGRRIPVVFASTGSVYGAHAGALCTEDSPPAPVSLYGVTKAAGERILLGACGAVALRFATAYGVSPRMRQDLLPNHLVSLALREGRLSVYQPGARRTFLHVRDAARAVILALGRFGEMRGRPFNAGSEDQNLTKGELCALIAEQVPGLVLDLSAPGSDPDCRDYAVSYARIRALGFSPTVRLEQGIAELVAAAGGSPPL
jgi:nucleoside-diphosphate-sugar epimerase